MGLSLYQGSRESEEGADKQRQQTQNSLAEDEGGGSCVGLPWLSALASGTPTTVLTHGNRDRGLPWMPGSLVPRSLLAGAVAAVLAQLSLLSSF